MITVISWQEIYSIWRQKLWPDRQSPIEKNSAMEYLRGHDMYNMTTTPTFIGYKVDEQIIGVNSGHRTTNNGYRSRGLWVDPIFRGSGIGQKLLMATIDIGKSEGCTVIWSYPRQDSWSTYQRAGFTLSSNWQKSETSCANAFCYINI